MIKLGIVGAGKIVQVFLSITKDLPEIELTAIIGVEQDKENMMGLQEKYGIQEVYTEFDKALTNLEIDTIYIALPNDLHYSFTKRALEAGKNVICEKPFTLSLEQLLDLEKTAHENKVILVEAITNQYLPNYESIKNEIKKIGDIKIVECNYSQYSSRYDLFKEGTILPAFNPKKGGGALMDINIYNIHFVLGLFGKPMSVSYAANVENGIDTSGILSLDYDDKKVICIGSKDSSADIRSVIQGTRGSIIVNGPTNVLGNYSKQMNREDPSSFNDNTHPHRMYNEFVEFSRMIETKDFEAAKERMTHSKNVMEIVDLALADSGIVLG